MNDHGRSNQPQPTPTTIPGPDRRTGPTTGNFRGNDLPTDAKTTRDTRSVEDGSPTIDPDRGSSRESPGSGVSGSGGCGEPNTRQSQD